MQKKVLAIYYSQSGQLKSVLDSILKNMQNDSVEIVQLEVKPKKQIPYPWSFFGFMSIFPECVYMDGCEVEKSGIEADFDLIVLAYQPWFLSPSMPITGFLKTAEAKQLLQNKPVVTLIACRNMWLMAQEKIKIALMDINAKLLDNIVLIDQGGSFATFITTPRWMLTGKKDSLWGLFPKAGVSEDEMIKAGRFGIALKDALKNDKEKGSAPILNGLKAVSVNEGLIKSEEIGHKSFLIWGKIIKKFSKPQTLQRKIAVSVYLIFLILLIVTIVPLNMALQYLIYKIFPNKIRVKKAYYEAPSGSDDFKMKVFSHE